MVKAALLMLTLVVVIVGGCEWYLRSKNVVLAYDDGPPLWSHKRGRVYEPSEKTVVFIGSSRIKYDLNIPTWENLTGTKAVQLAIEGSNPRPILEDLANDPKFKGRLVVDVTEGLFFSNAPPNVSSPNKNIQYYHDLTPAQRVSFWLNKPVESAFVFWIKKVCLSMPNWTNWKSQADRAYL